MSAINHPAHYNVGRIEVIDAIEDWNLGFSLGNAVKYIARAEFKGKPVEDLEKAAWYLRREIERRQKNRRHHSRRRPRRAVTVGEARRRHDLKAG